MKNHIKFRAYYLAIFVGLISMFFVFEALICKSLNYHFSFVGYGGTFKYNNLNIFGVSSYWICMLTGLFICIAISIKNSERYGFKKIIAIIIPIVYLLLSLVGAKLLYALENITTIRENGISFDGLSLYGAIYIFPPVALLISGFNKNRFAKWLDYCTTFTLVLLICVRTGCFLSGCCGAFTIWNEDTPIILPVQLFEVVFDILILELCLKFKNTETPPGKMYPVFMISYSVIRFFIEYLRNSPKDLFGFSNGQLFAVIGILFGILLYVYFNKKSKIQLI